MNDNIYLYKYERRFGARNLHRHCMVYTDRRRQTDEMTHVKT